MSYSANSDVSALTVSDENAADADRLVTAARPNNILYHVSMFYHTPYLYPTLYFSKHSILNICSNLFSSTSLTLITSDSAYCLSFQSLYWSDGR